MYREYFGLSAYPFSTTPDPHFYYPSAKHREALACLLYAVEQRKGFALITGEVGSGKTMLCRAVLDRFPDNVETALIVHTLLGPDEFCQAICAEFGLLTDGKKIELLNNLKGYLIERSKRGRNVVLIVDEAQNLSLEVLEELRLLGNLETSSEKLVQIILVGQTELRRLIGTPPLRSLEQRITVKFHLDTLSSSEVSAYIDHRLRIAGLQDGQILDAESKLEVFKASRGVPRLVNIICDQALLLAYVEDERSVTADTIRRVISEWEGYYDLSPKSATREPQAIGPRDTTFVIRRDNRIWGSFIVRDGTDLLVGRDPDQCGLTLPDPGVSRRHCLISNRSGKVSIEDVGSRNGSFVNGGRVVCSNLSVGDVIRIGNSRICVGERFHEDTKETAVQD